MGFFQTIAQTVHVFKSDTSDLERGLKKIQGEEKKAAQATLDTMKARNTAIDQWTTRLANGNQILELATKAIQFGAEAWGEYEKAATKAGGAQAEKAKQMRDAMDQWNESMKQTKIAIGSLVAEMAPLIASLAKTLGLIVQIGGVAAELPGLAAGGAAEAAGGSGSSAKKWGSKYFWRVNPATAVWALGSDALGAASGGLDTAYNGEFFPVAEGYSVPDVKRYQRDKKAFEQQMLEKRLYDELGYDVTYKGGGVNQFTAPGMQAGPEWRPYYNETYGKKGGAIDVNVISISNEKRAGYGTGAFDDRGGVGYFGGGGIDYTDLSGIGAPGRTVQSGSDTVARMRKEMGWDASFYEGLADSNLREMKTSIIEQAFGPLDEVEAYQQAIGLLAESTNALTAALQGGFDAWVNGSKTAAQAFKSSMGQVVMALASNMFAHALSEGALAIGSLAAMDFKGAGAHAIAAAKYGATGIAIGAIARATGASGWGGGGQGGGGYGGGGGGSYGGGGGGGYGPRPDTTTHVYVGDLIRNDRFQRQEIDRQVRRARKESGTTSVVEDN